VKPGESLEAVVARAMMSRGCAGHRRDRLEQAGIAWTTGTVRVMCEGHVLASHASDQVPVCAGLIVVPPAGAGY
jgi:hypothetical protein